MEGGLGAPQESFPFPSSQQLREETRAVSDLQGRVADLSSAQVPLSSE